MDINLNEFQTPLSEEFISKLPHDVYIDITEYLREIEFISSLISPDMLSVQDLPRDSEGKIILWEQDDEDRVIHNYITNPHRLVNMDYFRPAALYYKKHGTYTTLTPNKHPKSPYRMHWNEEIRRCKEGFVRPDGEWIPGELYFYWNYCPIMLSREVKGTKKANRVQDFPDPWLGDYLWFHYVEAARSYGMHVAKIKCRGIGASFKGGVKGPYRSLFFKKQKTFYVAYEKEYLTKDGILNKAWDYMDFLAQNTPFPRMRLTDSLNKMVLKLGRKDLEDGTEKGTLGEIIGISTRDDPDKPRGKRGSILFEEFGKYPKITDTWNICRPSVEDGDFAFDQLTAFGTGGSTGADFQGAEDMMYNPATYKILPLPNVFDKNSQNGTSIFHWGSYLSRKGCINKDGMPDVVKALKEVCSEFYKIKQSSTDGKALTQRRAELAITIKDAIMRVDGTLFPVADLKDYLDSVLIQGESFRKTHYSGELISDDAGNIKWRPSDKKPHRKYKYDNKHPEGAVELFQMPQKDSSGVIANRYIIGVDPYDDDIGTSLGSIFVFDTWNQCIVAEYTGRPLFANDFFEIVRRLGVFYNAVVMYENNKKGLFTYFDQHNCVNMLADVPQILLDKDMLKGGGYGNKSKGIHATKEVNGYARSRIREWLLSEAHYSFQEFDDKGEQSTHRQNIHIIRSTALLDELIAWNPDGNFDRVSSLGIVMIYNEERKKYLQQYKETKVVDEFTTGDYFTKNFDNRFSHSNSEQEDFEF